MAEIRNSKAEIRNGPGVSGPALRPLVRVWTWIAIGAGVWMLGYYLPTYELVFRVPVLNVLRCPARMVLGVELALATLAAVAIHAVSGSRETTPGDRRDDASAREEKAPESPRQDRAAGLERTLRRAAWPVLPCAMLGTLVLLALAAWVLPWLGLWGEHNALPIGGPQEALAALRPTNPAVWGPLLLAAATGATILWWLGRPARRGAVLVALILADLFLLTRFVDVQPRVERPDLSPPPASAWLRRNGGPEPYRVWGLSKTYFHRQRELLLPKTCGVYGVASIASYGPFQSPAHAHLLGLDIFGRTRDWANLLRRNRLLSLYNVRYILAEANSEYQEVLESVRVAREPAREEGPNLLGGEWSHYRTGEENGTVRLRTPFLWSPSEASTAVWLEPNAFYRISLEARGPDGGAANFLRADIFHKAADYSWFGPDAWGLTVPAEQIVTDWRAFRWTLRTEANFPRPLGFRLYSMSERPIEVRRLSVRKVSGWDVPEDVGSLRGDANVYVKVAELPTVRPADPPVVIYENLLARANVPTQGRKLDWTEDRVEAVKWDRRDPNADWPGSAPDVGLHPPRYLSRTSLAPWTSLPAAVAYGALTLWRVGRARRRKEG